MGVVPRMMLLWECDRSARVQWVTLLLLLHVCNEWRYAYCTWALSDATPTARVHWVTLLRLLSGGSWGGGVHGVMTPPKSSERVIWPLPKATETDVLWAQSNILELKNIKIKYHINEFQRWRHLWCVAMGALQTFDSKFCHKTGIARSEGGGQCQRNKLRLAGLCPCESFQAKGSD